MKKTMRILAISLVVVMLSALAVIPTGAVNVDWSSVKLEELFTIMNSYIEVSDTILDEGMTSMRGFAVSPDGKYAFGGFLNPNSNAAVNMFDLDKAESVSYYVHDQTEGGRAYPKGLAVDDRGYVYVGEAYYQNYGEVNFAILSYSTGELVEEGFYNAYTDGKAGDKSSPKLGVNGVDVQKLDGKYYMYLVVNYDQDYLMRFDVTDVKNPKLDTTFGVGGKINLQDATYDCKEGNYLDVDEDGLIYLGVTFNSGEGMLLLSADGTQVLNSISCKKGYAVALWEDYLIVTSQSGPTCLNIYDRVTLNSVATVAAHAEANSYVYVAVVDGVLYVADQASSASDCDGVIVAALTDEGAKILADRRAGYEKLGEETTTAAPVETTTAPSVDETTPAPSVDETTPAPSADETTPAPSADETTPAPTQTTTKAPEEKKSGCGSVVALGILAVLAPAAVIVCRKKED